MRLHRFYINQEVGAQKELKIESPEFVHQVHSVFRLKSGDEVIVFDGSGSDFLCRVMDFDKKSMILSVESAEKSRYMPSRKVVLCASVVKKDNFEWIVEKATELGVSEIIPVISERSEKKNLNMDRLKKISIEASEQSGRGSVPHIGGIKKLEEVINEIKNEGLEIKNVIAFHTESTIFAKDFIKDIGSDEKIAILIGSEGGYSADEIDIFIKNGIPVVTLGDQVLRAETAVITSLSLVLV